MHANIRHGQHALPDRLAREPAADRLKMAGMAVEVARDRPSTPFDYMFLTIVDDPANRLPQDDTPAVIAALRALGAAMVEEQAPPAGGDSSVPPIYTYWGQFIDHDVTLTEDLDPAVADMTDPAFVPLAPDQVVATLRNLREPTLDWTASTRMRRGMARPGCRSAGTPPRTSLAKFPRRRTTSIAICRAVPTRRR
jgi:hypothetical protein